MKRDEKNLANLKKKYSQSQTSSERDQTIQNATDPEIIEKSNKSDDVSVTTTPLPSAESAFVLRARTTLMILKAHHYTQILKSQRLEFGEY